MRNSRLVKELGFHLLLGFLALRFSSVANLWMLFYFLYAVSQTIQHKNRGGEAHWYAAYFMAYEAFYRMTGTSGLPYEFGKYSVILLLCVGMMVELKRKKNTSAPLFYLFVLLPSILLTDFGDLNENRKQILFYLSGPICLAVATRYFYGRNFNAIQLRKTLYYAVLGFIPMLIYLYGYVPLEDVEFNTDANFATTGGFGSNQVSTAIGLAIMLLMLAYLRKEVLFKYKYLDWGILIYAIFRGLLSFSRGGMIIPVVSLMLAMILFSSNVDFIKLKIKNLIPKLVLIAGLISGVFYYANELTGDKLLLRYTGFNAEGDKKDMTSGRLEMVESDWELFTHNPVLGVGVGMAKVERAKYGSHVRASHTELTRLLAEHGSFGLIALLILLFFPISQVLKNKKLGKANFLLVAFVVFAIGTMSHSAMRMAIPAFIYGMAFLNFKKDDPTPREQISK
jgi:hypothetical protein